MLNCIINIGDKKYVIISHITCMYTSEVDNTSDHWRLMKIIVFIQGVPKIMFIFKVVIKKGAY